MAFKRFQMIANYCICIQRLTKVMRREGWRPTDPMLNINWPLEISEISQKDSMHPLLTPEFKGIE